MCFMRVFYVFFSNLYLYNTVLSVLFCANKDIIIFSYPGDVLCFILDIPCAISEIVNGTFRSTVFSQHLWLYVF